MGSATRRPVRMSGDCDCEGTQKLRHRLNWNLFFKLLKVRLSLLFSMMLVLTFIYSNCPDCSI